ncbi:MAG: hypothetical protein ACI94O_002541, partial [Octadecabacter sp.]
FISHEMRRPCSCYSRHCVARSRVGLNKLVEPQSVV